MDAVEFLEEKDRMCHSFNNGCRIKDHPECVCEIRAKTEKTREACAVYALKHPAEIVAIVERWAKEHPRKTRQSEFLKMFPKAGRGEDGLIVFCPEDFDSKFECPLKRGGGHDQCGDCRREYWLKEVEDDASEEDPTK